MSQGDTHVEFFDAGSLPASTMPEPPGGVYVSDPSYPTADGFQRQVVGDTTREPSESSPLPHGTRALVWIAGAIASWALLLGGVFLIWRLAKLLLRLL